MNANRVLRRAQKSVVAAVVAVVTATCLVATAPTTTSAAPNERPAKVKESPAISLVTASTRSPYMATSTYESGVQYWVNRKRAAHGLRALRLASCTDAAAERWASYLASNNLFYHQSMTKLLYKCDAYYAGETLGRGSISPHTLVNMWMNSTPHRHVLLSRSPRRIGVGAVPNARGEWVVAAEFMRF